MATTQIIRPDADVVGFFDSSYGNPSEAPVGAATRWQAMSDELDTSYVIYTGGSNVATGEGYSLTTYTLTGNQRCSRIRAVARLKKNGGNTTTFAAVIHGYPAGSRTWSTHANVGDPAVSVSQATVYEQAFSWKKPSELSGGTPPSEFTQTEISGLRWEEAHFPGGTGTFYNHLMYDVRVELEIIEVPAVAWDHTTLNADTLPKPTFRWTYTGNGEIQKKYRVKVFTNAQVVGGGFDPDVTVPVYDSGEITDSLNYHNNVSMASLALNTDHRAYIKVAKDFNGTDWWTPAWTVSNIFTITENPVTTVTAPTGTITTNTPTITWTYADGNSTEVVPQLRYSVKLYRKLSGSWPAGFPGDGSTFDAAVLAGTIVSIYEANEVISSATSLPLAGLGISLANSSNFRTYVRTVKGEDDLVGGIGVSMAMYSAWDNEEFNTNFAQPPTPLISVVRDPAKLSDHLITVTPQAGTPSIEYYNIYRSIAGGPYLPFHIGAGAYSNNQVFTSPTVFRDAEAPQNVAITYAAESVDTGLGTPVVSNLATAVITNTLNQVWLKIPLNPTLDARMVTEDVWLAVQVIKPRSVHAPLGRNNAVVVSGGNKYDQLQLTTIALTRAQYDKVMALMADEHVLFLQTPKESWYVQLNGDIQEQAHLWDGLHGEEDVWRLTIPFVEVATDA